MAFLESSVDLSQIASLFPRFGGLDREPGSRACRHRDQACSNSPAWRSAALLRRLAGTFLRCCETGLYVWLSRVWIAGLPVAVDRVAARSGPALFNCLQSSINRSVQSVPAGLAPFLTESGVLSVVLFRWRKQRPIGGPHQLRDLRPLSIPEGTSGGQRRVKSVGHVNAMAFGNLCTGIIAGKLHDFLENACSGLRPERLSSMSCFAASARRNSRATSIAKCNCIWPFSFCFSLNSWRLTSLLRRT